MKTTKTIVIVGNGVAAWRVNAELEKKFIEAKIIRIGSEAFSPKCSFRTTSINCLRGVQRGISPLGDLMYDSHFEFEHFFKEESPTGVNVGYEWQLWSEAGGNSDKWERRFSDWDELSEVEGIKLSLPMKAVKSKAYLIDPYEYYQWHNSKLKKTEHLDDHVIEVNKIEDKFEVKTQNSKIIIADKLILCAGYMAQDFNFLVDDEKIRDYLNRSKPVRGTYLEVDFDYGEKSFSLAIESKHLIYRASDKKLLIGSTSENNNSCQIPMEREAFAIYDFVDSHLKDFNLPPKEKWRVKHGIRFKGAKRTPWWGQISENCYGVFGLYKNAFSFSIIAGKNVATRVKF